VKVKPGEIRPPSEDYRKEGTSDSPGGVSSGRSPPAFHGLPLVLPSGLPAPILFYHILVRQVAAHATAIGSVRRTAAVPATMDGTEVVAGAAAVALPVSIWVYQGDNRSRYATQSARKPDVSESPFFFCTIGLHHHLLSAN
jgi:hypothetical protein